jgi:hypothetical protein
MADFIFDGNDPASRKQRIAKAMMRPPQDLGSGIASVGDAVAYRAQQKQGAFPEAPGNNPTAPLGRLFGMLNKRGLT